MRRERRRFGGGVTEDRWNGRQVQGRPLRSGFTGIGGRPRFCVHDFRRVARSRVAYPTLGPTTGSVHEMTVI